jgi:hypothetical protein
MANIARVEPGKLVLDPFLGTASILVGAPSLFFMPVFISHSLSLSLSLTLYLLPRLPPLTLVDSPLGLILTSVS